MWDFLGNISQVFMAIVAVYVAFSWRNRTLFEKKYDLCKGFGNSAIKIIRKMHALCIESIDPKLFNEEWQKLEKDLDKLYEHEAEIRSFLNKEEGLFLQKVMIFLGKTYIEMLKENKYTKECLGDLIIKNEFFSENKHNVNKYQKQNEDEIQGFFDFLEYKIPEIFKVKGVCWWVKKIINCICRE